MSRKSTYKQVLSIGTAVVLGFALFTGSLDGAPKLLSPQSDEQAVALAEKQNESPSRTDDEADLVARLESGTASAEDPQNSQDSGDGSDSAATDTDDDVSADSAATPIDEVENPDLNRARCLSQQHSRLRRQPLRCPSRRQHAPARHTVIHAR